MGEQKSSPSSTPQAVSDCHGSWASRIAGTLPSNSLTNGLSSTLCLPAPPGILEDLGGKIGWSSLENPREFTFFISPTNKWQSILCYAIAAGVLLSCFFPTHYPGPHEDMCHLQGWSVVEESVNWV